MFTKIFFVWLQNRKAKENDGKENINSLMCGMQKIKLIHHITGIPQF